MSWGTKLIFIISSIYIITFSTLILISLSNISTDKNDKNYQAVLGILIGQIALGSIILLSTFAWIYSKRELSVLSAFLMYLVMVVYNGLNAYLFSSFSAMTITTKDNNYTNVSNMIFYSSIGYFGLSLIIVTAKIVNLFHKSDTECYGDEDCKKNIKQTLDFYKDRHSRKVAQDYLQKQEKLKMRTPQLNLPDVPIDNNYVAPPPPPPRLINEVEI